MDKTTAYDILIFSAHPDDAEFAMGGTLLKLTKGYSVAHVILTRGEAGTHGTPAQREQEAKAAGEYAGCTVEFLEFTDNHVEDTVENALRLAAVIRRFRPKIIFAPYYTNDSTHTDGRAHPDHLALGRLAVKAARFAKFKNAGLEGEAHATEMIIFFMVPAYLQPTFVVDISDTIAELQELWRRYATQLKIADGKLVEQLLLFRRAAGALNGVAYAEPFLVDRPLRVDEEMLLRI